MSFLMKVWFKSLQEEIMDISSVNKSVTLDEKKYVETLYK